MSETYFVEERSGVIGIGPLTNSPDLYYRRPKTNWGSTTAWIHLIICMLAIPLIIWNLFLLLDTITSYSQVKINPTADGPQFTSVHPLGFLIVLSAILINLLGGVFALTTEAACFSDKLAQILYIMAYLSIAISVYVLVFPMIMILWSILLFIWMVLFGFGFWRFTIISSIYLNEEGPVWFKPLLYGCLAALPLLTTGSQCRDAKTTYGCLPNDLFGGRIMYNDFYSFIIMTIIAVFSAIPYLLGVPHNEP